MIRTTDKHVDRPVETGKPSRRTRRGLKVQEVLAIAIGSSVAIVLLLSSWWWGSPAPILIGVPMAAGMGACLWLGLLGRWPGMKKSVHPAARVVLALIPLGINAFVALVLGTLSACDGDLFCAGRGPEAGVAIGLATFFGLAAVEVVAFAAVFGAIRVLDGLVPNSRRSSSARTP